VDILLYIGIPILILLLVFRTKRSFSKYRSALNALMAKQVFDNLPLESQQRIIDRTQQIMFLGGSSGHASGVLDLEPRVRYSFFALAMAELNIPPPLPKLGWNYVRNPFVALIGSEKQIRMARMELEKHGIRIEL
jgi:uncharacterized protein YoaH (UPF0181 family)